MVSGLKTPNTGKKLQLCYVGCILNIAGTAFDFVFIMILITLISTRISPSPDNFKRLIKCQTFQTPIYSDFESMNQW